MQAEEARNTAPSAGRESVVWTSPPDLLNYSSLVYAAYFRSRKRSYLLPLWFVQTYNAGATIMSYVIHRDENPLTWTEYLFRLVC